jgi:hypothetical protein
MTYARFYTQICGASGEQLIAIKQPICSALRKSTQKPEIVAVCDIFGTCREHETNFTLRKIQEKEEACPIWVNVNM